MGNNRLALAGRIQYTAIVNSLGLFMTRTPPRKRWLLLLPLAFIAGCGRDDIQVYKVGKEAQQSAPNPAGGNMPPGHPDVSGAMPKLQWKLPSGWEEITPGAMRLASFKVAGPDGKQADVGIFPLPGMAGSDLANVNRWRGQVGLPPVSEEELPKQAETLQIGGSQGQLYDLPGQDPTSGAKVRILAAISRRDAVAWFFKMNGEAQLVAQQKPNFIEFLKSLTFPVDNGQPELPPAHPPISEAGAGAPPASGAVSGEGKPAWQVPAGWQEVPGGQFLVAKFSIAGPDNAQATVNVSSSAGTGGGLLANVNRWRGQLGLTPLANPDLGKESWSFPVGTGQGTLVDMSGTDARTGQKTRLIGAIVPQGGQTWFYKLMGNPQLAEQQKEAFTKFVQTVKYAP